MSNAHAVLNPTSLLLVNTGRRGLVEKSSLIRHPSNRTAPAIISQHNIETKNAITAENHCFIKDVVEQVVAGDGVGWLKLSRLKKLMEDENYRNLVLSRMNKTLDRRISPDDHIDDVVSFETNNINLNPIPRLRKKIMVDG